MRLRVLLPSSMPLTVPPCALLLLLCSSTSCLGTQYQDCHSYTSTHCGNVRIGYPFGKIGSGCGDPEFQLECAPDDQLGDPLLNINGNEYRILKASSLGNNGKHSITIVSNLFWASGYFCLSGNSIQWHDSFFHMTTGYTIVTFWKDCFQIPKDPGLPMVTSNACDDPWYYSLGSELDPHGTSFCKTHFQLPIKNLSARSNINQSLLLEGFEITWCDDPGRNESCSACLESNGSCGYNISEPKMFFCHCPNGKCLGNGGPNKSAIAIGCSIGGVALTAIALVLFLKLYGKRRKQPAPPRSSTSKVEKFLSDYAYEMPARYSLSQLKKITNDFAEKLGEGGFGVVYKGKLRNGTLVAVKLLDRHRHSESTQFMNEVATIGRLHHVNLVRLLGYCFESPTSALVYEYMVNGSLEKIIFAGKEKGQILMWEQLHSIALGAARGIAYLHQDCEKRIIHFDIKPHNILLDADFAPKVSDFGLAKLCEKGDDHISMSAARGTPGYVAPELCDTDHSSVTDKADVYSFGVLLLEIVGGRKNIDWKVSRSSQFYFPEWAFKLLESGELGMRLRRGGEMEAEDEEKARRLTKVGLWCIQCNYRDRPSMSRVVQMLEGNGDDVANPPLPLNSPIAAPENPLLPSTQRSYSSL